LLSDAKILFSIGFTKSLHAFSANRDAFSMQLASVCFRFQDLRDLLPCDRLVLYHGSQNCLVSFPEHYHACCFKAIASSRSFSEILTIFVFANG
ncbi:MAG TPA: hypothetical protein PLH99_10610, partial [Proteiniphilum sp.]|nr:hypothetical protein [Proteiniphilum sp.]